MLKASPLVEALHTYSAPLEGRRGLLRLDFTDGAMDARLLQVSEVLERMLKRVGCFPGADRGSFRLRGRREFRLGGAAA